MDSAAGCAVEGGRDGMALRPGRGGRPRERLWLWLWASPAARGAYPTEVEGALAAEGRAYNRKPVRVVAIDGPFPQVIVYLDLTRKECSRLLPSEGIFSHPFYLAGQEFYLVGGRELDKARNSCGFALYLQMQRDPECSKPITLDREFASKTKTPGKIFMMRNDELTFDNEWVHGYNDLFEMPWLEFIADNDLFIDDVLHLRADVAVVAEVADLMYICDISHSHPAEVQC
ncbi:hypothetical protein ACQ4PT_051079 [Festuca glaucescens]